MNEITGEIGSGSDDVQSDETSQGNYQAPHESSESLTEPEKIASLVRELSSMLDNGNQSGRNAPAPLQEARIKAIHEVLTIEEISRLRAQIAMIS